MFLLSLGHIAFVLCLLFAGATQAYACATTWPETLFFDVIPEKLLDADVIAKVSLLTDVSKYPSPGMEEALGAGAVSVVQIIKTSDARLHQDEKIAIKVDPMTCSYIDHNNGDEGIIIAKARSDAEGRLVLCLYTRNLLNRHITPPSAYECLPDEVQETDQTRLAAENGDAKAQVDLGLIYERGHEVRKNNEEAMK
ncbi:MAG: hypothetical protein LBL95_07965, partial [Deltaproteobacteria bacterium]|nr:hypothetical protein [Deltaproteobacteria bacterium]